MSFSITATGHNGAVAEQVKQEEGWGDTAVFDAVKRFVAEILPHFASGDGVRVKAGGHVDDVSSYLNIEIEGIRLSLDLAERPGGEAESAGE